MGLRLLRNKLKAYRVKDQKQTKRELVRSYERETHTHIQIYMRVCVCICMYTRMYVERKMVPVEELKLSWRMKILRYLREEERE